MGKAECEPRIKRLKQRVAVWEEQLQQLADEAAQQRELRVLIGQLEEFVAKVRSGLAPADGLTKREILRALVRRGEIGKQEVTVVFRVGPDPFVLSPDRGSSQHCWGRHRSPLRNPDLAPGFQDRLPEMEHGGILYAPRNLLQEDLVPDRVERAITLMPPSTTHPKRT
jgi:site-specific DNA recombinase